MGCRAQGDPIIGCRRDRTIHLTQRHKDFCFTTDSSGKGCALEENNSCFQSRIEEEVEVMDVYYSSFKLYIPTEKRKAVLLKSAFVCKDYLFFLFLFFLKIFCPHRLNTSHHNAFLAAAFSSLFQSGRLTQ